MQGRGGNNNPVGGGFNFDKMNFNQMTKQQKSQVPCPFLSKPGGCNHGDKCNFSHGQNQGG